MDISNHKYMQIANRIWVKLVRVNPKFWLKKTKCQRYSFGSKDFDLSNITFVNGKGEVLTETQDFTQ